MKKRLLMLLVLFLSIFLVGCELVSISNIPTDITTTEDTITDDRTTEDIITDDTTTEGNTTEESTITYQLNAGVDTVLLGETWVDAGVIITVDNTDVIIYSEDTINNNVAGHYQVSYIYQESGHDLEIQRNVSVIKKEDLMIILNPGIDTVYIGEDWVDAGATISTEHQIMVINEVNTLEVGIYYVIYYIEDETGIITQTVRAVHVIE